MSTPSSALQDKLAAELSGAGAHRLNADLGAPKPLLQRIGIGDWLFLVALALGAAYAHSRFSHHMDGYDKIILWCTVPTLAWLGWAWKPLRTLTIAFTVMALGGIYFYQGDLMRAKKAFFLKYFWSSQSAIIWMSALVFMATATYWFGLIARSAFATRTASRMTWVAVALGFTGLLMRWYESYLMGPDIGHIPISNLYEVFVLFNLITALFLLYFEARYAGEKNGQQIGPFVSLIIAAATAFLLWYTFSRGAHEIQPLVPALQSWWMKIHVPANFVGYGAFAFAAMLAVAYLLVDKGIWVSRLPTTEVLDDIMYKAISIGFAFFTIATILGALWAAEAWGTYWQWDPKETWALIVWLNYAAWLHIRLVKGLRGPFLAWWSVVGLLVTTFAFLGVNIFLSGLHSYGTL
jgi:cytochrome c-type biogenesis protein CcsB